MAGNGSRSGGRRASGGTVNRGVGPRSKLADPLLKSVDRTTRRGLVLSGNKAINTVLTRARLVKMYEQGKLNNLTPAQEARVTDVAYRGRRALTEAPSRYNYTMKDLLDMKRYYMESVANDRQYGRTVKPDDVRRAGRKVRWYDGLSSYNYQYQNNPLRRMGR